MTKHQFTNGTFFNADCFDVLPKLRSESVDMILADLPYGTTSCLWDSVLPFDLLWQQYIRVTKPNAAIVLTASQPFASALVASNYAHFRYELIWDKVNRYTGALLANSRPMKRHENILVFFRQQPTFNKQFQNVSPIRKYISRRRSHGAYVGDYNKNSIRIGHPPDRINPCSVLPFKGHNRKESGLHPTQKPVALFEYLIKTYTNKGDTVLDNTAGSGTTAVAACRLNRRWICIEKDSNYYAKAIARVDLEDFG